MKDKKFINLPVGETFVCGTKKLMVKESEWEDCDDCIFNRPFMSCDELKELEIIPECYSDEREDGKYVVFEEVENERDS